MTDHLNSAPSIPLALVEWRVNGKAFNGRALYVPYIDARDCARLLDEWVGPDNWQDKYEEGTLGGQAMLWCYLSVRSGDEWVTKVDVGTAGTTEHQKALVSDAFKRCAIVKWGVGRNVYDLPKDIWASVDVRQGQGGEKVYKSKTADAEILEELTKRNIPDPAVKQAVEEPKESGEIDPTPGFDAPREVEEGSAQGPSAGGAAGRQEPGEPPASSPPEQATLGADDVSPKDLAVRALEAACTGRMNGPDGKAITRTRVDKAIAFATTHNGGAFPQSEGASWDEWPEDSLRTVVKELQVEQLV